MSTGNKRVTQLVELTAIEVAEDDLFYIVDSSAKESKKITAEQLSTYLSLSGSLYVVRAILADTASYILGSNVVGTVLSSSYADASMTTVSASYALSAKSSSWGQRAETASFAMGGTTTTAISASHADFADSASYAQNAALADNANVAAYLYYAGGDNGTASYAMKTGLVTDAINAQTASYMINGIGPTVDSASYADIANIANSASFAGITRYLVYSPTNGTASYAIQAGSVGRKMNNFGIWNAFTSSNSTAIINDLDVRSSYSQSMDTVIEVYGNSILQFTSSAAVPPSLSLFIFNRTEGAETLGDNCIIGWSTTPVLNKWNSLETGSFYTPFHLIAQLPMYGQYYLVLTSSHPTLTIDTASRAVKFSFTSYSDNLDAYPDEDCWDLLILPPAALLTYYSGSNPPVGPFTTGLGELLQTGSSKISYLDCSSQNITDVRYTYYLETCSVFICNNNPLLSHLDTAMPYSLQRLECSDCGLISIYDLSITQLESLSCSYNSLTYLPSLPPTLKYVDCGFNFGISALPSLPSNLEVLMADFTAIQQVTPPLTLWPSSLITASLSGSSLLTLPNLLPSTLAQLNIGGTGIVFLPTAPVALKNVNLSNCGCTILELENFTTDLVTNGQTNGFLDLRGYGTFSSVVILTNISQLTLAGWTVLTDP